MSALWIFLILPAVACGRILEIHFDSFNISATHPARLLLENTVLPFALYKQDPKCGTGDRIIVMFLFLRSWGNSKQATRSAT